MSPISEGPIAEGINAKILSRFAKEVSQLKEEGVLEPHSAQPVAKVLPPAPLLLLPPLLSPPLSYPRSYSVCKLHYLCRPALNSIHL